MPEGYIRKHNIELMEIIKTIQDLRIKFNKEIKTLKKIQVEMEMELKRPITHLENSNERLTSRLNQAESRISDFKDKVEFRDQLGKEYEKNKPPRKEYIGNVGHYERTFEL